MDKQAAQAELAALLASAPKAPVWVWDAAAVSTALQRVLDAQKAGQASDAGAALLIACIGAARNAAEVDGTLTDAAQLAAFKTVASSVDTSKLAFDNAVLLKAGAASVSDVSAALSAEFDANANVVAKYGK